VQLQSRLRAGHDGARAAGAGCALSSVYTE
jgi:hypothetical protein